MKPLLSLQGLSVTFGGLKAVSDLNYDLEAGMRLYREAGGTNAVLANVLVDLSNQPQPGSLAERAAVSLVCSPDEARVRLKRIELLGFDEVLVVSPGRALDELERVRDFL